MSYILEACVLNDRFKKEDAVGNTVLEANRTRASLAASIA